MIVYIVTTEECYGGSAKNQLRAFKSKKDAEEYMETITDVDAIIYETPLTEAGHSAPQKTECDSAWEQFAKTPLTEAGHGAPQEARASHTVIDDSP